MKRIKYIISVCRPMALLITLAACSTEADDIAINKGPDYFSLSATKEQLITRSGEVTERTFAEGTKYRLYGIISNEWSNLHSTMSGAEGTETVTDDKHSVSYLTAGTSEDRFEGKTLSFYGLTYGNTTTPACMIGAENVPFCKISADAKGTLPDLRRAVLLDRTGVNSGLLNLSFKHTLAKLKFEVVKQKDAGDNITLTEISVKDYNTGTLNLNTGKYMNTGALTYRTVVGGISQTVSTTVSTVNTSSGAAAECLIFPTVDAADGLEVTIKTTKTEGATSIDNTHTYKVEVPKVNADGSLSEKEKEPFRFQPNCAYTLTITITNDKVQVIAIIPRYYDWIETTDNAQYLGQPITFNGVIWMDRNLGAKSADVSTPATWEDARGYYYSFGRNVPYYVKREITGTDGITRPKFYENSPQQCAFPYPYIEGHKDDAYVRSASTNKDTYLNTYAMNPGETTKSFQYTGTGYDWKLLPEYNWARTPANGPCPTGWRLPTTVDVLKIWVIDNTAGDLTFLKHSGSSYTYTGTNDPETGARTSYFCRKENGNAWGTIYAIKYLGKSEAYRLKWSIQIIGDENINDNKGMASNVYKVYRSNLVISRYPASNMDAALTAANIDSFDWEHPAETMYFPIMGYICNDGWGGKNVTSLVYPGMELVMMATNMSSFSCASYALKYAGSASGRYMYIATHSTGIQVRCVRDN